MYFFATQPTIWHKRPRSIVAAGLSHLRGFVCEPLNPHKSPLSVIHNVFIYIYIYTHVNVHKFIHMYICVYIHMWYMCTCTNIYTYMSGIHGVCVYIYIYIYIASAITRLWTSCLLLRCASIHMCISIRACVRLSICSSILACLCLSFCSYICACVRLSIFFFFSVLISVYVSVYARTFQCNTLHYGVLAAIVASPVGVLYTCLVSLVRKKAL